jgi:putative membrane protein
LAAVILVEDFPAAVATSAVAELLVTGEVGFQMLKHSMRVMMEHPKSKMFFSESDKELIRRAVEGAEAATSGEIATMMVDQSDRYREAEVLGGVLVSGLISLVISAAVHYGAVLSLVPIDMTIWSYIPLVLLLYFPARRLFIRFPHLKVPFIGKARMMHAVRERAVRAFYEKGLYRTRDENGILIFISLLERKVWILGDRGVDRRIPLESWHLLAREVSSGIGSGHACPALCEVIGKCGHILAEHFPRKDDDTNELTDELIM